VWSETAVSDAVVRVAIGALRKALDDTVQTPRFIATVPRRGYRFLAPVTMIDPPETDRAGTPLQRTEPVSPHQYCAVPGHGDDVLAAPGRGSVRAGEQLIRGTGGVPNPLGRSPRPLGVTGDGGLRSRTIVWGRLPIDASSPVSLSSIAPLLDLLFRGRYA